MGSNNHKMMIDEKASIKRGMFTGEVDLVGQVTLYTLQLVDTTHNTTLDRTALPAQLLHSQEASLRN